MSYIMTERGEVRSPELCRYLSPELKGLVSIRSDGWSYLLRPFDGGLWRPDTRKPGRDTFARWQRRQQAYVQRLPGWQKVCGLPGDDKLLAWLTADACEATTGELIEPEAYTSDGAPSWLRVLGLLDRRARAIDVTRPPGSTGG